MCTTSHSSTETVIKDTFLLELLENHLIYIQSLQKIVLIEYSSIEKQYLRDKALSLHHKIESLRSKINRASLSSAT